MAKRLSQSGLVPAGFAVVGAWLTDGFTTLDIRSTGSTSRCPSCGALSHRVHSRYIRRLFDLPIAGKSVTLRARVRRFRCQAVLCGRRIFAKRAMSINPDLLSAAERLQYEGYLRREEANAAVFALSKDGVAIKEIVRPTGHSRGLVRQILRGQRGDVFRLRESSLEGYLPWLDAQWSAGRRNGGELWRQLRTQGFRGSVRVVTEWATRRRRADQVNADTLSRILRRAP